MRAVDKFEPEPPSTTRRVCHARDTRVLVASGHSGSAHQQFLSRTGRVLQKRTVTKKYRYYNNIVLQYAHPTLS